MRAPRTVHILLFPDIEVLDFAGPYEVFHAANEVAGEQRFEIRTVAEEGDGVRARGGLRIIPELSLEDSEDVDVAVVPGGFGTRAAAERPAVIDWIRRQGAGAELVLSVCTGALLLGRAGLLAGKPATTHHTALDRLRDEVPSATVMDDSRFVEVGSLITAAGVSAGIDAALRVVERLLGETLAGETARYMEYERRDDRGQLLGR